MEEQQTFECCSVISPFLTLRPVLVYLACPVMYILIALRLKPSASTSAFVLSVAAAMEMLRQNLRILQTQDDCFEKAASWERLTFDVGNKVNINSMYYKYGVAFRQEMRAAKKLKGVIRNLFPEVAARLDGASACKRQACQPGALPQNGFTMPTYPHPAHPMTMAANVSHPTTMAANVSHPTTMAANVSHPLSMAANISPDGASACKRQACQSEALPQNGFSMPIYPHQAHPMTMAANVSHPMTMAANISPDGASACNDYARSPSPYAEYPMTMAGGPWTCGVRDQSRSRIGAYEKSQNESVSYNHDAPRERQIYQPPDGWVGAAPSPKRARSTPR
jgi:hypothetical protein